MEQDIEMTTGDLQGGPAGLTYTACPLSVNFCSSFLLLPLMIFGVLFYQDPDDVVNLPFPQ